MWVWQGQPKTDRAESWDHAPDRLKMPVSAWCFLTEHAWLCLNMPDFVAWKMPSSALVYLNLPDLMIKEPKSQETWSVSWMTDSSPADFPTGKLMDGASWKSWFRRELLEGAVHFLEVASVWELPHGGSTGVEESAGASTEPGPTHAVGYACALCNRETQMSTKKRLLTELVWRNSKTPKTWKNCQKVYWKSSQNDLENPNLLK